MKENVRIEHFICSRILTLFSKKERETYSNYSIFRIIVHCMPTYMPKLLDFNLNQSDFTAKYEFAWANGNYLRISPFCLFFYTFCYDA